MELVTTATPDRTTDEALLARCAAGDRAAFDQLVDRHGDALFRFTSSHCGSSRDAEDALQDGLLAAWRGASTFRAESSARTWLYQVVLHACRRRSRRRAGEPALHATVDEAEALPSPEVAADDRAASHQVGAALERALARLPEESREVLLLRDVEGMPGAEAAAVLGIGLAAMKSRLHRARLELKAQVEELLGHALEEVIR
jgi:RNA polymerase sigma-70 factor (ECF subfamily)